MDKPVREYCQGWISEARAGNSMQGASKMSTTEVRYARKQLEAVARLFTRMLEPAADVGGIAAGSACEEVVVAGSFRREAEYVGDLEFVLLPHRDAIAQTLFGATPPVEEQTYSILDRLLRYWVDKKLLTPPVMNGPRMKRFFIPEGRPYAGLKIELYVASPNNFGNTLALRTGPEDFTKALFSSFRSGGILPDHLTHTGGNLWYRSPSTRDLQIEPCRTEERFFRAIKVPYIEPCDRTLERLDAETGNDKYSRR